MDKKKRSREELIAMLPSKGWHLVTEDKASHLKNSTLEELVRETHGRRKNGINPGLISKMEDTLEVDMAELQELWIHLGLPM